MMTPTIAGAHYFNECIREYFSLQWPEIISKLNLDSVELTVNPDHHSYLEYPVSHFLQTTVNCNCFLTLNSFDNPHSMSLPVKQVDVCL